MTAPGGASRAAPLFTRCIHADWSLHPAGRWMASARWNDGRWWTEGPAPVGALDAFVDGLFAGSERVLAAFDFPIGFPAAYARKTGFDCFREILPGLGHGAWARFFEVAEQPSDIGLTRPFYPPRAGGRGTVSRRHLFAAHGASPDDLLRRCERRTAGGGRAAGMMFWTLGAAAVGKAALHGWRTVLQPACERGACLWPFDGDLPALAARAPVTLAESYPGDAYGQIGLPLRGWAKTNPQHRADLASALLGWAGTRGVSLAPGLQRAISSGFPPDCGRDNGFDAVVGLFAALAVMSGERPDGAPDDAVVRHWEGWILGRAA